MPHAALTISLEQILAAIDRASAWAWVRQLHLPGGVICPVCGAVVTGSRALASFENLERTYCAAHGSTFRPQSAVAQLRGTEWSPEEYWKLRLLHQVQLPPAEIARILGKSAGCVRDMIDRCAALDGLMRPGLQSLAGGSTDKG